MRGVVSSECRVEGPLPPSIGSQCTYLQSFQFRSVPNWSYPTTGQCRPIFMQSPPEVKSHRISDYGKGIAMLVPSSTNLLSTLRTRVA